jgi:eukaryotic-like serine/threonine-protein kinase
VDPAGPNGSATTKPSHRHVTGPLEPVGPATDVFGLGIVLKHVLIWEAVESKPMGATLIQRENEKEDHPFRAVSPRIPRRLQRICEKAMAPDQNRRYQSAAELARALRRYRARRWLIWTASVILAAMAAQFIAGH